MHLGDMHLGDRQKDKSIITRIETGIEAGEGIKAGCQKDKSIITRIETT